MKKIYVFIITGLILSGYFLFIDYIIWDFNQIIALLVLPLVLRLKAPGNNIWLPFLTLACLLISFLVPEQSILFISWLMLIALLLNIAFQVPAVPLLMLIFVISPLLKFINNMIGFPLRLWLSDTAGSVLSAGGMEVVTEGNLLYYKEVPFFVNEACAGMNMLSVTLIAAIAFMAYHEFNSGRKFSFSYSLSIIIIATALNIITNLIRIVTITALMVFPEHWMHDVLGLLALIFYTLLPLFFIVKLFGKYAKQHSAPVNHSITRKYAFAGFVLLFIFIISGFNSSNNGHGSNSQLGFEKIIAENGLIYRKKISRFYNSSHDPKICWTGSGYELTKVDTKTVDGKTIYFGHLSKDNDKLYTTWWWTDGKMTTINPFIWRMEMLKEQTPFYLINLTAEDEDDLKQLLNTWINKH